MPKLSLIQTNFTAGEITPRMKGRVDVARYANGADILENGIPVVHGGVDRRAGLRYLATAKYAGARRVRLIRYVFNEAQAYMVELGHGYARFFDSSGAIILDDSLAPLEVASPYTEDQIFDVRVKQGADTMFMMHKDVPTQRLQRISAGVWTLRPVPWVIEPFAEIGHSPGAVLSLSDTTVGSGRTFTTSPTTAPGAPTIGAPSPLNAAASVAFTPPASTGGLPITSYTATSSPGGITGTDVASPIRVGGLTNGVAYTFTVHATNGVGDSAESAASAAVTPSAALPSTATAVTATPKNITLSVPNGTQLHLLGPTATASGGLAPYTYDWTKISGSVDIIITRAKTAQVEFSSSGRQRDNYAAFRCTATDALGGAATVDVNITVIHEAIEPGGVMA